MKDNRLEEQHQQNSYVLIRRGAVTAEIPYNIKLSFFTNDEGSTKYNPYGKTVDLGWRVAA